MDLYIEPNQEVKSILDEGWDKITESLVKKMADEIDKEILSRLLGKYADDFYFNEKQSLHRIKIGPINRS